MTFLMGCLEYRAYKIFSEESLQKWDDLSYEEQHKYRMKAIVEVSNKHITEVNTECTLKN